ncbi:MAG TPA: ABC transporter substrate-binding protein [Xanthobacteraceae bacterium]|jgi:putative ABC transport system substrate-binding protein
MRRRKFITLLGAGAAAWPLAARAQQAAKVRHIGFLRPNAPPTAALEAFRRSLREAGYVEGTSISIDFRYTGGSLDALSAAAHELVKSKVEVIVTASSPATIAAKRLTSTIPIVFVEVADPIGAGLVGSLARPEANVTGASAMGTDVSPKRFEILREIAPPAAHIAVLWNPANPTAVLRLQATELAAQRTDVQLIKQPIRRADEIDESFAAMSRAGADALIAIQDTIVLDNRERVVALAAKFRLPAIYDIRAYVEVGGLVSYGANFAERFAQAGAYVVRILNGKRPADLPIDQPTKFELVINLKAAKALGLTISHDFLLRADDFVD